MSGTPDKVDIHVDRVDIMTCEKCRRQLDVSEIPTFTPIECPACGHSAHVPGKIAHFLLLNLIGMGGMGGVYCAKDLTLGRLVAIKVMLKQLGDDRDFVGTFQREAQAAAQLNHPHVAQIYSFGEEQGQPYIVMELVSGKHLDQIVDKEKRLDQSFCMKMGAEIAEGLDAGASIGLLHSDVKPENILFDESGKSKLVDFGLATFVDQQVASGIWGTPYYISPERVRRERLDLRSDIYSLGATLYHCLTGRPPFDGKTPVEVVKARLKAPPKPMEKLTPDLHPQVVAIVKRMLEVSPARRYPNYRSLLGDMRKALESLPTPDQSIAVTQKKRVRRTGKRQSGRVTGRTTTGSLSQSGLTRTGETHGRIVLGKGDHDSVLSEYRKPALIGEEDAAARKKNRIVAISIVSTLVAIAAIIGVGFWVSKRQANEAQKRERQQLETQWLEARDKHPGIMAEIASTADSVSSRWDVVRAVVEVINEDIKATRSAAIAKRPPEGSGYEDLRGLTAEISEASGKIKRGVKDAILIRKNIKVFERGFNDAKSPQEGIKAVQRLQEKVEQLKGFEQSSLQHLEAIRKIGRRVGDIRVGVAGGRSAFHEAEKRWDFSDPATILNDKAPLPDEKPTRGQDSTPETTNAVASDTDKPVAPEPVVEKPKPPVEPQLAQADIDRELKTVDQQIEAARALAKTHQYESAKSMLGDVLALLRSDEAKSKLRPVVWRYQVLSTLPKQIESDQAERPLATEWSHAGARYKVLEVTAENGVRIKGRIVRWREMSPAELLVFVKHMAATDGDGLTPRNKANRDVVAAVYCFEHGGESLARQYAQRAITRDSGVKADVDKLLPGLVQ